MKVTTSKWSTFLGMPVAVLGHAYFLAMTVLLTVPIRNRRLALIRVAEASVGVVSALYLVYVELWSRVHQ